MTTAHTHLVDLTRDLRQASRLGASAALINTLVGETLDALRHVIPYELATIMELKEDVLSVRVARGRLANGDVERHRIELAHFPSIVDVLRRGRTRAFTEEDHSDGDGDPFDGLLDFSPGHFCMVAPIRVRDEVFGVMTLDRAECGSYSEGAVELADVFAKLLAMVLNYGEQSSRLERIRCQLAEQNRLLSERGESASAASRIEACRSPAMVHLSRLAQQVAATDAPVLITGETGTGKELLATAIHSWSARSQKPFVAINCAALPAALIESELFGHIKGAFTGATRERMGRFQTANGGTLFLDEIGELAPELQAKLLRVLQDGCFEPVGSDRTIRVDVRVIAATNQDLSARVEDKRFREDLYYRLVVFPIHLPPLRARPDDIEVIARSHLDFLAKRTGRGPWQLDQRTIALLRQRTWKGNVRELVNVIERATILSRGPLLCLDEAPDSPQPRPVAQGGASTLRTLRQVERDHIERALQLCNGRIHGTGGAAELLDINPSTLRSRMAKLRLTKAVRPAPRATSA